MRIIIFINKQLLLLLLCCLPFTAQANFDTLALKRLPLEELADLDILVTSAGKKEQPLSDTPAAVFVINSDDIKNSGAATLPDVLRMAPGIQVARIDVNKWSVTARGFSGRFANKLLVMIDGRTVYNPLFSGVYWDTQNAQLENIDRIEIIRGPGAAIWGANAVNGVINIITKTAQQTQGGMISAGVGDEMQQGFARYGGQINPQMHYRVYADFNNHQDSVDEDNRDTADQWDQTQGGFRLDWQADKKNSLTLIGDYYDGSSGHNLAKIPTLVAPFYNTNDQRIDFYGGNISNTWRHQFNEENRFKVKLYYDFVGRESDDFKQRFETLDLEVNQQFKTADWNEINWGIGYRVIFDKLHGYADITLQPEKRNTQLFSAFIQDEITLIPNTLKSTIALRFEHNDFSGDEWQPTARLLWTPNKENSFWLAFSRAVRTPTRSVDIRIDQRVIPGAPPRLIAIFGNPQIDSEEVIAYEAGYRFISPNGINFDLSFFYNQYEKLRTFENGAPGLETLPTPHILIPVTTGNNMHGESYGFEAAAHWQVNKKLSLHAAYSLTKINLKTVNNSLDATSVAAEGETPQQQFSLRSYLKFAADWSGHFWFRYVDSLPAQHINDYVSLDAKLAWRVSEQLQLSVSGHDLLDSKRVEYNPEVLNIAASQVERSVFGKIIWTF